MFLKTFLVLTNKSIKNSLTTSKQLRVQLSIFLTNNNLHFADFSKLHFIKVQLHYIHKVVYLREMNPKKGPRLFCKVYLKYTSEVQLKYTYSILLESTL